MKVILRRDVDNLGRLGDVVSVKPGYGRNYLLPQGFAVQASPSSLKLFEQERHKLQIRNDAIRAEAAGLAGRIEAAKLVIEVRTGENDKLYGSITSSQLASLLLEKGVEVDRRKIILHEGIRTLGEHMVEVRLHPEVVAHLSVTLLKHGHKDEPEEAATPEAPAAEDNAAAESSAE